MIKVLAILTGELCFDGITNSVLNYYSSMDHSNMKIGIVSARKTDPLMKKKFEEIGCKVFPLENRDNNTINYMINLISIIKKEKYNIVHAHGNSGTLAIEMIAAKLSGCPVRIVHSRNSFCEHKKIDKLLRPLMYVFYTDGFSCGQKAGEWLFKQRPFTIINNGKEIEKFMFNPEIRYKFRNQLNCKENEVLLGHVGLFHKQKNHKFLIEIFEQICLKRNNYRLILIGEGENKKEIQQIVQEKGLEEKVSFLGRQTNIHEWLQALDIMIFPSFFEGMPNVVLEWQLAGLPAVISDVITKECALMKNVSFLSLEKNAEFWAKYILEIDLDDRINTKEEIRKKFIKNGFDIYENAKFLKKKYKELLEKRK